MKIFLSLSIIIFSCIYCFSQEKQLLFTDDSSFNVSNTNFDQKTPKVFNKPVTRIIKKEFTALLTGIGKAFPSLNKQTETNIGRKNRALARQIRNINSSYYLTQDSSEYYFAGFNSINYKNFANCLPQNPCRVKIQSIIIQTTDSKSEENILIITSIQPLKPIKRNPNNLPASFHKK